LIQLSRETPVDVVCYGAQGRNLGSSRVSDLSCGFWAVATALATMFDCDISQSKQNSLSIKRFLLDVLDSYVRQARVSVRSMVEGAARELGLPQMADSLRERLQLAGSKEAQDIVRAFSLSVFHISKELYSLFLIVATALSLPHIMTSIRLLIIPRPPTSTCNHPPALAILLHGIHLGFSTLRIMQHQNPQEKSMTERT
jgi:hypothetical protein